MNPPTDSWHAGYRLISVPDPEQSTDIPLRLVYPTTHPESPHTEGPYGFSVALDAPVAGSHHPLVVISHGSGGTGRVHRDLAQSLARAGCVVALPDHPGNTRGNNALADTVENLVNRPRHITRVLTAVQSHTALGAALMGDTAVVVGHSMGGYTALALAGGRPWTLPSVVPHGPPREIPVPRDPRVCAVALLAPAAMYFLADGALRDVTVPVFLRTGEQDTLTPAFHRDVVLRGLPPTAWVDHAVVPGAGHFSFQSPFPPAMVSEDFPPSQDPPGFDRGAYQAVLHRELLDFVRARTHAG